jgi:hypothetical protein
MYLSYLFIIYIYFNNKCSMHKAMYQKLGKWCECVTRCIWHNALSVIWNVGRTQFVKINCPSAR